MHEGRLRCRQSADLRRAQPAPSGHHEPHTARGLGLTSPAEGSADPEQVPCGIHAYMINSHVRWCCHDNLSHLAPPAGIIPGPGWRHSHPRHADPLLGVAPVSTRRPCSSCMLCLPTLLGNRDVLDRCITEVSHRACGLPCASLGLNPRCTQVAMWSKGQDGSSNWCGMQQQREKHSVWRTSCI